MVTNKFAAILGIYGKPSDRFMSGGYKSESPDVFSRINMAARHGLVQAVELIEGEDADIHSGNLKAVQAALIDHNLQVCSVNPNLWGQQRWAKGTLGSTDPKIYQQAIEYIKHSIDLAAEIGCENVGIWPGQDGYDYLFEVDYTRLYDQWVQGVQELADYNPTIKLCLEYKPFEPRTHSIISTAPKTLLMLNDIDRSNVGLVLDVGHALYARENLGETVALSQRKSKLFHIHLNDNFSDWDWDLNFGSVHLFDFLEMIYWLKRTSFSGWYSIDIFTYRLDATNAIDESLYWLQSMLEFVEDSGMDQFDLFVSSGNPLEVSEFFRNKLFPKRN